MYIYACSNSNYFLVKILSIDKNLPGSNSAYTPTANIPLPLHRCVNAPEKATGFPQRPQGDELDAVTVANDLDLLAGPDAQRATDREGNHHLKFM